MRAISICQCANCGSCARNQLNAERTSGDAERRDTSRCNSSRAAPLTVESDESAREEFGLIGIRQCTTQGTPHGITEDGDGGTGSMRVRGSPRSRHDGVNQFAGNTDVDSVRLAAPEDGSGDRVEFRRISLLDIFLHGALHARRRLAGK
jgi:hypothetical protein